MTLPSKYPYEPPRFRFLTIPFHPNISAEGTVVFNLNDRNYTSSLGIDFIILQIIDLLKNPDPTYAINSEAMNLFTNDIDEFNKRQKEGNVGIDDYHQYLDGVRIYSEIPDDAFFPSEDRTTSRVVSLTTETINKAAMKEGEVNDKCLLDINNYEIISKIGEGGFAIVYLIADRLMHYEYAAKVPLFLGDDGNPLFDYIKEVNVISTFNHGAILKIYGYCLKDFNGEDNNVIIMENIPNGDLKQIIEKERNESSVDGWDDTQKLINLYGIASGMAYSISYGIAHSDLKPSNILMTNELYPKITDFDTARLENEGFKQSFNMSGKDISSPLYTAPEIIDAREGYEQYAEKSDVYSFSIIAYEIITSKVPFPHFSTFKLYKSVMKGKRPPFPDTIPERYKSLITDAWRNDPRDRPTFKEIADRLKSDEFVHADEIDYDRVLLYFDYIENYKTTLTESKRIHPKTKTDKTISISEDVVIGHSDSINIINLNDYNKKDFLGKGRFGQVFLIVLKESNQFFAAKISNQPASKILSNDILREINIMKNLNHPAILKFVGYSPVDFNGEQKPTIITEYAPKKSLLDIIEKRSKHTKLNDTKILIISYGIAAAMAYLHDHSILHNDLKPSNVLLDENLHPKICDFGLSEAFTDSEDNSISIKGTPSYIAPEIWDNQKYAPPSDVYSFAILLYELVFSKRAFKGMKPVTIGYNVANEKRPEFPFIIKSSQKAFKSLIKKCWNQDPNKRLTFKQILTELQDKNYQKNVDQKEFSDYVNSINVV